MKIYGLKHLNGNLYDSIMIRDKNLNFEPYIKVKNKDNFNIIKSQKTFYDSIKDLSTKEKISEIIRYFLRNNRVYALSDRNYIERYKGSFLSVFGTRDLHLQLAKDSIDTRIIKEIINKYNSDRELFVCENQNIKNIEIFYGENAPYYQIKKDKYSYGNPEVFCVRLMSKEHKLMNFENIFIDKFIKEKIDSCNNLVKTYINGLYVTTGCIPKFSEGTGYFIKCDEYIIKLDRAFFYRFYNYIEEHNKKINETKKLQLTFDDVK